MKDFHLIKDESGYWNPYIDINDAASVDGFETAMIVTLFTNARIDESEISDPIRRGGWWGNVLNPQGYAIGSKNWVIEREKITNKNRATLQMYTKRAVRWMTDLRITNSIAVTVNINLKLNAYIVGIEYLGKNGIEYKYSYDWKLTDVNKIA